MSSLLFPYGSARISRQAKKILTEEEIKQMLYQHTTGAWENISQSTRDKNLFQLKHKAGIIKNGHLINGNLFIIYTYLDVSPSFWADDTPNYIAFDSDQEKWAGSSFPEHNLTFISLGEYDKVLKIFSASDPLGGYFLLLNDSNQ